MAGREGRGMIGAGFVLGVPRVAAFGDSGDVTWMFTLWQERKGFTTKTRRARRRKSMALRAKRIH
jgi:hypothetical protein